MLLGNSYSELQQRLVIRRLFIPHFRHFNVLLFNSCALQFTHLETENSAIKNIPNQHDAIHNKTI